MGNHWGGRRGRGEHLLVYDRYSEDSHSEEWLWPLDDD